MRPRPLTNHEDIHHALEQLAQDGPAARREPEPRTAPEFIGSYQVINEIGEGGAAKVLRVRHIHPSYAERTFALKILHQQDRNNRELFRKEAYLMAQLEHPNIVRTFEAGVEDDQQFIVMEYISGRDLWDLLDRGLRLNLKFPDWFLLHVLGEVLRGLVFAHELNDPDGYALNVIHFDVNPTNVFLSFEGQVKLGDFGVAAITGGNGQDESQGKVGYFAPEQFTSQPLDQRVDVFSFGVMMFELLCGVSPFESSKPDEVLRLNSQAIVPKPSSVQPGLDPRLEAIILKALQRRPSDRFATARLMLEALEPLLPPPDDTKLAVSSIMRTVFLHEYVKELQMRRGLSGGSKNDKVGNSVLVHSESPESRAALGKLMEARGFKLRATQTPAELASALGDEAVPTDVLVIDVSPDTFASDAINHVLAKAAKKVPVVAYANQRVPALSARATAIHALDLVFEPLEGDRLQTSLWVAIMSTKVPVQTQPQVLEDHARRSALRLLLVSQDVALASALQEAMPQWGYELEVVNDVEAALRRCDEVTFHGAYYDVFPRVDATCHAFAEQIRGAMGMGCIPVVYLAPPEDAADLDDIPRSAVCSRLDDAAVLATTMSKLRSDVRGGRSFTRYSAQFTVELRFSGRSFGAQAQNVSRGGIMLRCDELPPLGTKVQLFLALPKTAAAVEIPARVVRVDLPQTPGGRPGVGIEFGGFGPRHEAALIGFLRELARHEATTPS